uniref:Uncharacterized protein n=1 Tax=Moniliophthora roreri TaxID=221103 RepID=A0A0W0FCY5_MONRR
MFQVIPARLPKLRHAYPLRLNAVSKSQCAFLLSDFRKTRALFAQYLFGGSVIIDEVLRYVYKVVPKASCVP